VELKTARVNIASFEITGLEAPTATFSMSISAGGYVRSVAHELGQDLGCGGHLSRCGAPRPASLRWTRRTPWRSWKRWPAMWKRWRLCASTHVCCLPEMPAVTGDSQALGRMRNGAQANLPEFSRAAMVKVFAGQRELVGVAETHSRNAVSAGGGDGVKKQGSGDRV
jgi:tRNA pseudouridine55 synthase